MQDMSKLVYLVPLFPLLGFLINGLGRKSLSKSLISIVGSGVMLIAFFISVGVFFDVKANGATVVELFPFIHADTIQIPFAFQADQVYNGQKLRIEQNIMTGNSKEYGNQPKYTVHRVTAYQYHDGAENSHRRKQEKQYLCNIHFGLVSL